MTQTTNLFGEQGRIFPHGDALQALVSQVNTALENYSDKDWNYSRISLVIKPLEIIVGPYILSLEVLDQSIKQGRNDMKSLLDEVKWGDRHTSELSMLEVVSLRINKALLEVTNDEYWHKNRPVVRIARKQAIAGKSDTNAIWYTITEVAGEDFDNR